MEEIYKPEDKEADKVELYNRENNDILGDMPNWLYIREVISSTGLSDY